MNSQPLVCICIPNYNNEKTIAETLDSIVNQSYKNIIIKIFDNASTDNSMKILREYEAKYPHMQVFQNETNIGGEANFTKCIENMEGEYSAIYHADDVYMPTIVEEEVKALEENDISVVFTNAYLIDGNNKILGDNNFPIDKNQNFIKFSFQELLKNILKYDNFLMCPTAMSKTTIYKEHIQAWSKNNFNTASDVDVWLRFAKLNSIGVINKKLIKYRLSNNSYSIRVLSSRKQLKDLFFVLDYYINLYSNLLNSNDIKNYEYLKFKDNIFVAKNYFIQKENYNHFGIRMTISNIKKSILSARRIKYLVAAIFFKTYYFFKGESNR